MAERRRSARSPASRRKGCWGCFGLGAVVLGALWWESGRKGRREESREPVDSGSDSGSSPDAERATPVSTAPAEGEETRDDGPRLRIPPGAEELWVPGPGGVSLRVIDWPPEEPGRDVPILLIHGLGGRAEHWASLPAPPATRILMMDLPGHGGSDPLPEDLWSVGILADCAAAVLDSLALRRVLVGGHALGAAAALQLAAGRRSRVAGLLLLDPAADPSRIPEAQRRSLLESFAEDPARELSWYYRQYLEGATAGVAEAVLDELPNVQASALAGGLRASLEWSPLEALDSWEGPLRILLSPLQDDPSSLHRLRDLEAVRLEHAGHWLMMDRPDAVARHLDEMLAEVRRGWN